MALMLAAGALTAQDAPPTPSELDRVKAQLAAKEREVDALQAELRKVKFEFGGELQRGAICEERLKQTAAPKASESPASAAAAKP